MTLFLQASAPLIATQTEGSEIPVRSVYLLRWAAARLRSCATAHREPGGPY